MHTVEPFYNWQHIYSSELDQLSPFCGRSYSEFEFSQTVYNYYIHPQWDEFGSRTLYLKVLMADYEEHYMIIELLGEWNDALENDIMLLKREVLEKFMDQGIVYFILIGENVLNFHFDGADYYEEWKEELDEKGGWAVCLNLSISSSLEFQKARLDRFLPLLALDDWRIYKPFHLFKKTGLVLASLLLHSD
ncbi:MAG: hypothetical protein FJY16_01930 [Bacteroidetes bacterium]|nr:hypothetical protein [Bacteroidota bacterium]